MTDHRPTPDGDSERTEHTEHTDNTEHLATAGAHSAPDSAPNTEVLPAGTAVNPSDSAQAADQSSPAQDSAAAPANGAAPSGAADPSSGPRAAQDQAAAVPPHPRDPRGAWTNPGAQRPAAATAVATDRSARKRTRLKPRRRTLVFGLVAIALAMGSFGLGWGAHALSDGYDRDHGVYSDDDRHDRDGRYERRDRNDHDDDWDGRAKWRDRNEPQQGGNGDAGDATDPGQDPSADPTESTESQTPSSETSASSEASPTP